MVSPLSGRKSRSGLPSATRALIVASPRGAVQFASERAVTWVSKMFDTAGPLKRLPHPLTRWLTQCAQGGQPLPYLAADRAGRIRIDVLYTEGNSMCLLLEKTSARRASMQEMRPLTKREAEVLSWVARGKSNAEIATILDVCTKTVDKHLERIYPKLGVENRTAAANYVLTTAAAL